MAEVDGDLAEEVPRMSLWVKSEDEASGLSRLHGASVERGLQAAAARLHLRDADGTFAQVGKRELATGKADGVFRTAAQIIRRPLEPHLGMQEDAGRKEQEQENLAQVHKADGK